MTALTEPPRARITIPTGKVANFIRDLAARHGVAYTETASDRQANDFARLSDCGVVFDQAELLLIALGRAGVITRDEEDILHDAYIRNDLGLE